MLNIIFMGTPDFAVPSLDILNKYHNVKAVVTVPDKEAGRGRKIKKSAVKKYALNNNIPCLQPEKLKDESFIKQLKNYEPDLFVVVAFRILPKVVWEIPPKGTFNLHASLLPQYRGAAPINHAIINGENESGVTTFFIDKNIDTGEILLQKNIKIENNETAGSLHDKLMNTGAEIVLETVDQIEKNSIIPQKQIESSELKPAPKIFPNDCFINWDKTGKEIINLIRGLSPYPAVRTKIEINRKEQLLKIFNADFHPQKHDLEKGKIISDNQNLKIAVKDGFISLLKVQPESKKPMSISDFLRGYENRLPEKLK